MIHPKWSYPSIAILNRFCYIYYKWLSFIMYNYSDVLISLWILVLMTNNIPIFLEDNLAFASYIWSFEGNDINKDIDNNQPPVQDSLHSLCACEAGRGARRTFVIF
jgi:hypothetical protein